MSIKPGVIVAIAIAGVIGYRALKYDPQIAKVDGKTLDKSYPQSTRQEKKEIKTDPIKDSVNKVGGEVLGKATEYVSHIASNSAEKVEDFVIEKATLGVLNQVEKLPEKQRDKIKEILCK